MGLPDASTIPGMGSEGGFEEFEGAAPLRITGFISLIFGVFSSLALAGRPALILPVLAIIFGLIALRPSDERRPVGLKAAACGILLALAFGSCGAGLFHFKRSMLGAQAEYFAGQYIRIAQLDEAEIAMQLGQEHFNRLPVTVKLKEHYRKHNEENEGEDSIQQFRDSGLFSSIQKHPEDVEWVIAEPTRVYHRYGFDKADTYWRPANAPEAKPIVITMSYTVDNKTGDGHWRYESGHVKMKRLVAEKII